MTAPLAYRGVWISFLEWERVDFSSEDTFRRAFSGMAENCRALDLNTLIVHLRPFADALYPSRLFPWSHLVTGRQGATPAYDPLRAMLEIAGEVGLRVEAWINPYRILSPARAFPLAPNHPALRWMREDQGKARQRVLPLGEGLYFNPASRRARSLVTQGVSELLASCALDGVQIDDYFYPTTDPEWDRGSWAGETRPEALGDFRRAQVDALVRDLYGAVKAARPGAVFGISPQAGLGANWNEQYSDVERWLREPGFADYIMPQLYFGFHEDAPPAPQYFVQAARTWAALPRHANLCLYAGLGAYRVGAGDGLPVDQSEWSTGENLARMVRFLAEKTEQAYTGFALFRYASLFGEGPDANLRARERQALRDLR